MSGLAMRFQPLAAFSGNSPDHFVVKKLLGAGLDHGRILVLEIDLPLPQGMNRQGRTLPNQPEEAPPEFTPTHEASSPQVAETTDRAGLSPDERVGDRESRCQYGRRGRRRGPDERRVAWVIAEHGIGAV